MVIPESMDGSLAGATELCLFTGFVWSAQVMWVSVAVGRERTAITGRYEQIQTLDG